MTQQLKRVEKKKVVLMPCGDRLLVMPVAEDDRTASGLFIPDVAKDKPTEAIVVAVGPGVRHPGDLDVVPMAFQAGQRVLLSRYGGTEVKMNGRERKIVSASDVLAVVADLDEAVAAVVATAKRGDR